VRPHILALAPVGATAGASSCVSSLPAACWSLQREKQKANQHCAGRLPFPLTKRRWPQPLQTAPPPSCCRSPLSPPLVRAYGLGEVVALAHTLSGKIIHLLSSPHQACGLRIFL